MQRVCLPRIFTFQLVLSVCFAIAGPAYAADPTEADEKDEQTDVRYAAIGDSYTIGEGAQPREAWPNLLTKHLSDRGIDIQLVANPSRTGWTTLNALNSEMPIFVQAKPNFATLLIGVNDWVQAVDEQLFRKRLIDLMDHMLAVLPDKHRLLVITIPDFGVTPSGAQYSRGRNISEGIAAFNKIVVEEAKKRDLRVVDIFPLSKQMQNDRTLVAADGLHPSAKEYAEWEKMIFPVTLELLSKKE